MRDGELASRWETATERGNRGFYVQKALAPSGPYAQMTAAPVPSQAVGGAGASYRWVDATAQAGVAYWYQLVTVPDRLVIGPVAAAQAGTRVSLPVLSRSR